ncbi:MAG: DUF1311 domain-containing protein [Hydromonas sp.]|nr:DUF1311 domain-containing protein [Hydromonas sp.]
MNTNRFTDNIVKARKLLTIFILLFVSISTYGKTSADYDKLYSDCVGKTIEENNLGGINNGVVDACSNYVSDIAKKNITRLYKIFYNRLNADSPDDALKFEASQKSWLAYRNTHCELMGQYVGSPMYGFCPMQLNQARAAELQELVGE